MANEEPQHAAARPNTPEVFGSLYERHYSQIFGYVYRRILHWEVAQDITAEVFLKAWKSFWRFRWSSIPVGAWFYRIATNEVNMYFRAGKYRRDVSLTELLDEKGFEAPDAKTTDIEKAHAERELQRFESFLSVQSHLKSLPPKYQDVIALRYFEGKSIHEIAEILGKREGTVKSLLSRGLERLRKKLAPDATK
jgi:RNA polymerase sigma-70 factor (ECF subfamily)